MATGKCNESLLTKYGDNDFVIDDDIVLDSDLVYELYNTTFWTRTERITLKPFNPSNPFTVEWSFNYDIIALQHNMVGFILLDANDTCLFLAAGKTGYQTSSWNYFWVRAWLLGEYKFGRSMVNTGKIFSGKYEYLGGGRKPNVTSNLSSAGNTGVETIYNGSGSRIVFADDPRNDISTRKDYTVIINKLVIRQK